MPTVTTTVPTWARGSSLRPSLVRVALTNRSCGWCSGRNELPLSSSGTGLRPLLSLWQAQTSLFSVTPLEEARPSRSLPQSSGFPSPVVQCLGATGVFMLQPGEAAGLLQLLEQMRKDELPALCKLQLKTPKVLN